MGSVPAALLTVAVLHFLHLETAHVNKIIKVTLGFALMLTAVAILFKPFILRQLARIRPTPAPDHLPVNATIATGVVLGVIVTLSSIGAGALGTLAIFALYPLLPTARLVGTEIAHAVPLTLVAGLGHASMGNMGLRPAGPAAGRLAARHLAGQPHDPPRGRTMVAPGPGHHDGGDRCQTGGITRTSCCEKPPMAAFSSPALCDNSRLVLHPVPVR